MTGRPKKLTQDNVLTAVKLAQEGRSITAICRFLGVTRKTYYNWAEQMPELKAAVDNERRLAREREAEGVRKNLYRLTKKHKLVTETVIRNGDGEVVQTISVTKEVDPSVRAIDSYLDRNPDTAAEAADNELEIRIVDGENDED